MGSSRMGAGVLILVLGLLLAGCGSSPVHSRPQDLASRESLNADELDALTAAGENGAVAGFNPSAFKDGFQPRDPTFNDVSSSFSAGQLPMPSQPAITMPSVRQSNSIRQAW